MKNHLRKHDYQLLAFLMLAVMLLWAFAPWPVNASGIGVSGSGVGGMPGAPKFTGTVSSTKACAVGFSRKEPNYCHRNNLTEVTTIETWTSASACTARSPSTVTLPSDAKSVDIVLTAAPISNATVSWKTNSVYFFTSSACTAGTVAEKYFFRFRESPADTSGNDLAYIPLRVRVPLVTANTFYTKTIYANINGAVNFMGYDVVGYWD